MRPCASAGRRAATAARKVTTNYPGIAAHYMNVDYVDGEFELEKPEMLLYDGDGPTAGIVGLSYHIVKAGDEEPADGFTGVLAFDDSGDGPAV